MRLTIDHRPRYATESPSVAASVELLLSHYAARTFDMDDGPSVHAVMAEHALQSAYDPNTGGNVWLSYSIHLLGAEQLPALVIAGWDTCSVYVLPDTDTDPHKAAAAVWDMCGEDDSHKLAILYLEDDADHPAQAFADYCDARSKVALGQVDATFWKRQAGAARATLNR